MLYLPAEFPQLPDLCYMNHAAVGPWPRRTAQAVANFAQQNMLQGGTDYPDWLKVEQSLRERLAWLINAPSTEDIALVKNTSEGLSIISQGLDWRAGDEVVGLVDDFCSNQMVWQALSDRGVKYTAVNAIAEPDPENALIEALSSRTRLFAISTVHFATGYRFDMNRLAEACESRGILLSVDAIQSLGAARFDLSATPADFVVAGGHKWLLSPEGVGFFYCRAELRDSLKLHQYGWAMRDRPYAFESAEWRPAESARRFESGTPNMLGIHAMEASLSLFQELGMETVERRLADNISRLEQGLRTIPGIETVTPTASDRRLGILTFRHPQTAQAELHKALMKNRVICAARAGGIRLSPHFYTPESVLDHTIERISHIIQTIQ